jgi:molybdopterin synthase sulfur carrier subunit
MAITVKVPTQLRTLTGGSDEVQADGATLRELIDALETAHPGLKDRLVDEKGIRRFVNIYVGDEDVRFLDNLATKLDASQVVSIVPAIAGGV